MFRVGDRLLLRVHALSAEGLGIGRIDGCVVMAANTLPGEEWQVQIVHIASRYAVAEPIKMLSEAQIHRAVPACEQYRACGGCNLQHMDAAMQAQFKESNVRECFVRIGGIENPPLRPILSAEQVCHYRNKSLFPFVQGKNGPVFGMYARESHSLVETPECLLASPEALDAARAVQAWAKHFSVKAYDERNHTGCLRHIMVRTNHLGEAMVAVVTRERLLPHQNELIRMLHDAVPGLVSLYHNVNDQRTNVALGNTFFLLDGAETITEYLGETKFLLGPRSFFQVNHDQTVRLYNLAMEAAEVKNRQTLIDAYCGVGSIGQYIASHNRHVHLMGMEIVPEAVELARKNAVLNGLTDAAYEVGAAETLFPQWLQKGIKADVLVMDPPRKGCHPDFIQAAVRLAAPRMVYVSCNPATLARDAKLLMTQGYQLEWAQPVDMFPQTDGIETVACFHVKGK